MLHCELISILLQMLCAYGVMRRSQKQALNKWLYCKKKLMILALFLEDLRTDCCSTQRAVEHPKMAFFISAYPGKMLKCNFDF